MKLQTSRDETAKEYKKSRGTVPKVETVKEEESNTVFI